MARSLIVHPTDLREASEGAFNHALKLALAGRSGLSLVHVHSYDVQEAPDLDSFPQVRETLTRWNLLPAGAPQTDVGDKLGLQVSKGEVLALNAEAALAKMLHDRHAAMIVLGTRGLTGLKRLFEHSFSERLSRIAKIPALFVPDAAEGFVNGDDGTTRLQNVLIPVADDPDAAGAMQAATGLADLLQQESRFHLLHVGRSDAEIPLRLDDERSQNEIVRQGPVVETISRVADEVDADLIVMATAGHKDFLDALRGSTTEGVLRTARRPLLAVPAT